MKELVFVHGRSQEKKDAGALKAQWIEAWRTGLDKVGVTLPIAETEIRFPFYGDTLYDLIHEVNLEDVADVVVRGAAADSDFEAFLRSALIELQAGLGVSDAEIAAEAGAATIDRGVINNRWLLGFVKVLDRVPGLTSLTLTLFLNDVYQYLKNDTVQDEIDEGVRQAIRPDTPTVIVAHSLGTVVAYNLLKREGDDLGWEVPLFVTVGSPLALEAVRKALRPTRIPGCLEHWFNARDHRDIVALYPLDPNRFPTPPNFEIENLSAVGNHTSNRHGIDGYLDDPTVARRIADALTE